MLRSHQIILTLVLAGLFTTANAQDQQPKVHKLTAEQAVAMALKQRTEILNAQLDVKNQESFNREITGQAYPQLAATFGVTRNFAIPVTVLPDFISPSVYNVLESEDVRDGNGDPIKFSGDFSTFPAQFGVPWQAQLGVSVQQILFQPDVLIGLQARKSAISLYQNQLKISEDSVKLNVYNTYFGVLIAKKGLGFTQASAERLEKLYEEQTELYKNGFIEKLDLDKTKVNLNNIKTTLIRLNNLVALSYAGLKFALALPQKDSLLLTDSLTNDWIQNDLLAMEGEFKYEQRNEIKTLQSSSDLLALQVKRYKWQAFPTIAAIWNVGTSAQRQNFDFFDSKGKWFYSNVLGFNLSVPLIDANQRRERVKQAQYSLEKNQNTANQFKQLIDLQVINARTTLTNAIASLNSQEENRELADKVYNTTRLKYQEGLGSSFEVLQSETDLQTALNNYYQALYDAGIARISYLRALGKL
jgi:outer membrane protein TolC